jgi:hypothetical protein
MKDTICTCGHWYEEHDHAKECAACANNPYIADYQPCTGFIYDAKASTPEAIADRGGDPELWPQRVKDALSA